MTRAVVFLQPANARPGNDSAESAGSLILGDGSENGARPSPRATTARRGEGWTSYWTSPLIALLALYVALGGAGLIVYRSAKISITHAVASNLESVAKLKSLQIDRWLENAASGFKAAVDSPNFVSALQDWENDGERDGKRRAKVLEILSGVAATAHYVGVDLRSARDGAPLLATSKIYEGTDARQALAAASANSPVLEDFHTEMDQNDSDTGVRVGYFYPCRTGSSAKALAIVHVDLDPSDVLSQLALEWPSLSNSAETTLERRDGSDVVFLNRVRDLPGAKPMMRMPLARPDFVAAKAVVGGSGFLSGLDYTDEAVLAFALKVDDTPWFIVAQIDQAEVYARIRDVALLVLVVGGVFLALGCAWWATRNRYVAAQRRADLEVRRLESAQIDNLQRIAATSRRVVDVQELERRRLSGELHDLIGASLAAIELNLAAVVRSVPVVSAAIRDSLLRDTRDLLRETIVHVREFSTDLRPVVLDAAGVVPALEECALRFTRRTGIPADFSCQGLTTRLATQIETVIFRIAQEALTNCAKHANAKRVSIQLSLAAGRLELKIEDDGYGFDIEALGDQIGGLGLITMRERAEFAGGRLTVTSQAGAGTCVRLVFDSVAQV